MENFFSSLIIFRINIHGPAGIRTRSLRLFSFNAMAAILVFALPLIYRPMFFNFKFRFELINTQFSLPFQYFHNLALHDNPNKPFFLNLAIFPCLVFSPFYTFFLFLFYNKETSFSFRP